MPQLALLKITVYDDQSKQISHRVLPVVGLRPGYRYICLKNDSNQQLLMNTLFVHIQSHDYVPEEYEEFANALVNPISYVKSLSKKEEMLKTLTDDTEVNMSTFLLDYMVDTAHYHMTTDHKYGHKISKKIRSTVKRHNEKPKLLLCKILDKVLI